MINSQYSIKKISWKSCLKSMSRAACAAGLSIGLAGCAVPGMHLGLDVPGSDRPGSILQAEPDVSERADIFPINPATVRRLLAQKQTEEAALAKMRVNVASSTDYQYRIGPQDVLRIIVWDHPELNNPAGGSSTSTAFGGISIGPGGADPTGRVVNNDGTMFYPYVGMIQVAGKTVQEVRSFLEKTLVRIIKDPQVDVSVTSFRSKRIYLTGEFKGPGAIPVTDVPIRITDAIAGVGGLAPEADASNAVLLRGGKQLPIDLHAMLNRGDLSQNLVLQDGDALSVPNSRHRKIFVLGEVAKATAILLPRGDYTLTEALGDVGGVNQITSNAGQIYVIREGAGDRPQIYHLNAKAPDALILADRFPIKPRDVIYVDVATITRFNRVISQIFPSLGLLRTTQSFVE